MFDKLLFKTQVQRLKKKIRAGRIQTINKVVKSIRRNNQKSMEILKCVKKMNEIAIMKEILIVDKNRLPNNGQLTPEKAAVEMLARNKVLRACCSELTSVLDLHESDADWKDQVGQVDDQKKKRVLKSKRHTIKANKPKTKSAITSREENLPSQAKGNTDEMETESITMTSKKTKPKIKQHELIKSDNECAQANKLTVDSTSVTAASISKRNKKKRKQLKNQKSTTETDSLKGHERDASTSEKISIGKPILNSKKSTFKVAQIDEPDDECPTSEELTKTFRVNIENIHKKNKQKRQQVKGGKGIKFIEVDNAEGDIKDTQYAGKASGRKLKNLSSTNTTPENGKEKISESSSDFKQGSKPTTDSFFLTESGDHYVSVTDNDEKDVPQRGEKSHNARPGKKPHFKKPAPDKLTLKRKLPENTKKDDDLHPSWAAKLRTSSAIVKFQGKKIKFDE